MTTSIARSSHTLSLLDGEIVEESALGSMRRVTADNLPILKGLSIKRVLLNPGTMRTPHWHANANELTYCVSGTALVSILDDGSKFSTTVRENIAYGRPDATDEEIREAARRAQADEFISQLSNGYESEVGERGGHLSVGQRQRIGIARAFLKNAPILLLDEPTSALDPTTESAIMETIKDLMRGRTTIIITHRIATIHNVDQIVVLEGGRVVEQGRGPELVARGGVYAKLYASGKFNT